MCSLGFGVIAASEACLSVLNTGNEQREGDEKRSADENGVKGV